MRIHGTTQARPAEVFAVEEQPRLLPAPTARLRRADLRDGEGPPRPSHRGRQGALLGPGQPDRRPGRGARRPDAGADLPPGPAGQGPSPPGTRAAARPTPTTCPSHKTVYAMRDLDRLRRDGRRARPSDRRLRRRRCSDIPLPWTKMRQVYALLGLVKKWGPDRVDAACATRARARGGQRRAHRPDARTRHRDTRTDPDAPALPGDGDRRPRSPATPTTSPSTPATGTEGGAAMTPRADGHPRAAGAAAPSEARPLPRHAPRTPRPRPDRRPRPRRVPRARPRRRSHPPRDHLAPTGAPAPPGSTRR